MSTEFTGNVALITGAARGIGRACALRLAQDGADIVLNDVQPSAELDELAREIERLGRRVLCCIANVAEPSAVEQMFAAIDNTFGRLDILVNNAAWSVRKPFLDQTVEELARTLAVSLWGGLHCAQQAALLMQRARRGSIVIISSIHAARPYPNAAPYNAAKAGLNHLAASLALELVEQGIRVNTVEPGWIDTPGERVHNTPEEIALRGATLPMRRLGTAAEIADAVAYLCSPRQAYITGSTLRVDGGFALRF